MIERWPVLAVTILLGGDDDLSMSVGVLALDPDTLGSQRVAKDNEILVPRNAPTTFNSGLWKKRLFHDGRVERLNALNEYPAQISTPDEAFGDVDPRARSLLQAQAGFPVTSQHEMRAEYQKKSSNHALRVLLANNLIAPYPKQRNETNTQRNDNPSWESLFREVYQEYDTTAHYF